MKLADIIFDGLTNQIFDTGDCVRGSIIFNYLLSQFNIDSEIVKGYGVAFYDLENEITKAFHHIYVKLDNIVYDTVFCSCKKQIDREPDKFIKKVKERYSSHGINDFISDIEYYKLVYNDILPIRYANGGYWVSPHLPEETELVDIYNTNVNLFKHIDNYLTDKDKFIKNELGKDYYDLTMYVENQIKEHHL